MSRDFDWAHDFRDRFQKLGYGLMVPPTVVAELAWLAMDGKPEDSANARRALQQLNKTWQLQPYELSSVQEAVALRFANRLIEQGLLPVSEVSDGIILAETSVREVPMLASSDHHLLGIDDLELKLSFAAADLDAVAVASPRRLLKAIQ